MNDKTTQTAVDIIEGFEDKTIKEEVRNAQLINPMEKLGSGLLSFFDAIIEYSTSSKNFEKKVEDFLGQKMDTGEMAVKDAIHLLTCLKQQSAISDESLISLIRPAQGTTNPLLGTIGKSGPEGVNGLQMDNETAKKMHVLYRLLEKLEEQDNKKK